MPKQHYLTHRANGPICVSQIAALHRTACMTHFVIIRMRELQYNQVKRGIEVYRTYFSINI
jgi:hypothetical protein